MKCPHCKTGLQIDDWIDSGFDEEGGHFYVTGQCPSCFRSFGWERHYSFKEDKSCQEISVSW